MDSSGFSVNDPIHNLQHRLVLSRLTAFGPFQCTTLQTQVHILEEHEVLEDLVEKYLNSLQRRVAFERIITKLFEYCLNI